MSETSWFTYDDFAARAGQQYRVSLPDGTSVALILAEVSLGAELGGTGPDGASRRQFSLVFRGPADPQLGQGTWPLEHDEMDGLALFLVPIGPDAEGPRYEAVFA